ncbi:MAG: LysE family translocator [Alphaproteobacteria bacterium]|jgi:threonine/homoserine/homoserine lactone efflux protein|uniref:LysE family translocator n=1 Tax=Pacificispira sp. TaxID=2888761 RepID=UPI001B141136|nr:LysE family translocator [Alphaproteobacteria bacterium]MBO6865106.1 LysE family translocator [Alphaproteobacteria bacterium]
MVNIELYVAFCLATTLLILMPGPVVALVIATSLKRGTRFGMATMLGANVGTGVLLIAGAVGMTTLLALLSDVFDLVRLVGAAYLIYLGIKEWRSRGTILDEGQADKRRGLSALFGYGFLTGITNPKTIIFYAAFFPQFVDPTLAAGPQLAVMTASMLAIALVCDGGYAVLAGRVRPFLMDAKRALIRARITGTLLIVTGIGLALARRDG